MGRSLGEDLFTGQTTSGREGGVNSAPALVVDDQSIEGFEADLKNNLYKLWNRMSSGSYFPPPVKRVQIDKRDGGKRPLGIPTVTADYPGSQRVFGMG